MRTLPSPSVTSSSEIPDSETRSIRVFSLRRSMGIPLSMRGCAGAPASRRSIRVLGSGARRTGSRLSGGCLSRQAVERELECVQIAFPAETANDPFGEIGEIRMVPERLAAMHVRQVNLDERDTNACQRVPNRDAGMGVRSGVDQDEIGLLVPRGMDAIDEPAFMIALKRREFDAGVRRAVRQRLIDLRQGHTAINLRFPGAEKVEVGAVQNQQSRHGRFYFRGIRGTLALFREICLVSRTPGRIPCK